MIAIQPFDSSVRSFTGDDSMGIQPLRMLQLLLALLLDLVPSLTLGDVLGQDYGASYIATGRLEWRRGQP